MRAAQIKALGKATERDHLSLFNWIWKTDQLDEGYYDFVYHADDFVSVTTCSAQSKGLDRSNYFEDRIRSHIKKYPRSPFKVRCPLKPHDDKASTNDRADEK